MSDDSLRAKGTSLRRVRMVEGKTDDQGKRVWHAGEGVDVTTHVNWFGRAYRQTMTLEGRFLEWSNDAGVRTGHEINNGKSASRGGTPTIQFDSVPAPDVLRAVQIVAEAGGDDRYLRHLAEVASAAFEAGADASTDTVTTMGEIPANPKAAAPAAKSGLRGWLTRLAGG